MGRGCGGLLGASAFAIGIACATPSGFACTSDDECTLSGVQGICATNGHCAYPDDECVSGYSFPDGSPSMPGVCVDSDALEDGGGGSGSGDDAADDVGDDAPTGDGPAEDGVDDGSDGVTSTGDGGDVGTESGGFDESGDSTTDVESCPDLEGDSLSDALGNDACFFDYEGVFVDDTDLDVFALAGGGGCLGTVTYASVDASALPLMCFVVVCEAGEEPAMKCKGSVSEFEGEAACCGESEVAVLANCDSGSGALYLALDPKGSLVEGLECDPYGVSVTG